MMRYILLLIMFLWMAVLTLDAQEIKVTSFKVLENDSSAIMFPRLDLNENKCSILKIKSKEKNLVFEGNVIGEPIYQDEEIWIYMPQRSSRILIRNGKYGTLRYLFPVSMKQEACYAITLRFIESKLDDKIRTLVSPVAGICSGFPSFGIMLGIVKRTGFYLKFMNGFVSVTGSGYVDEKTNADLFTGKTKQELLCFTGGLLQRLWKPVYIYAGVGYGRRKLYCEVYDGTLSSTCWRQQESRSFEGLEYEIGGIYRYRNLAITSSVETNQFKICQINFGIGIMY
jgi:hypothetical protein